MADNSFELKVQELQANMGRVAAAAGIPLAGAPAIAASAPPPVLQIAIPIPGSQPAAPTVPPPVAAPSVAPPVGPPSVVAPPHVVPIVAPPTAAPQAAPTAAPPPVVPTTVTAPNPAAAALLASIPPPVVTTPPVVVPTSAPAAPVTAPAATEAAPAKRGRGRPPGAKNKPPANPAAPQTDAAVTAAIVQTVQAPAAAPLPETPPAPGTPWREREGFVLCVNASVSGDDVTDVLPWLEPIHAELKATCQVAHFGLVDFGKGRSMLQVMIAKALETEPLTGFVSLDTSTEEGRLALAVLAPRAERVIWGRGS